MPNWLFSRSHRGLADFGPNAQVVVERGHDGNKLVIVRDQSLNKIVANVSLTKEIILFPENLEYNKDRSVNNKIINRSMGMLMGRPKELALSMKQVVWTSSKDFIIAYNSLVKLNKIIGPIKRNQFLRAILELIMQWNIDYENYFKKSVSDQGITTNHPIEDFWNKINSGYSIIKAMFEFLDHMDIRKTLSKPMLKAMIRVPNEVNCRNKLLRFAKSFQEGHLDPSLLSGIPAHSWLMACHASGCPELIRAIILHTKDMSKEEAAKIANEPVNMNRVYNHVGGWQHQLDNPIKNMIQNLAMQINEMKRYYERQHADLDLSKSTFTSLKRKVNEWHEMLNHQERDKQLLEWGNPDKQFPIKNPKEVKLLVDDSEFEVQILKTPREMVEEGVVQQHCIAQYIPEAKACRSIFYGIRQAGKRVASAQVNARGVVMQIKGYHNSQVPKHLEETFREWVNLAFMVDGKNNLLNRLALA